jgi:regulator of sirC expression with transglutaminase-like and TPR domain
MDMSEQILKQLKLIKWLLAVICLSFGAMAVAVVLGAYEMSSSFASTYDSSDFPDRASKLLEAGKESEVLALSAEQEKKSPKDPYVHWSRGKAYYQLGQYPEALKSIQRVHELAPTWRQDHTTPYIKAIEEEIAKKR